MGLLLKEGIDINLIKSAFLAFSIIGFLITLINIIPIFKKRLPNYTLQLAGLIGNTSFLGIPIALALLPSTTINFTIGFDLGTTLFAWIFGPFFLQEKSNNNNIPNIKGLLNALINSPASRGIIGVLLAYLFQINEIPFPLLGIMTLAIINGLITSIILETIILSRQMRLKEAFSTATGMSLISMLSMEIAMNTVDVVFAGGVLVWWIIPFMLLAGFITPLPYNYYRLKKYNIACH